MLSIFVSYQSYMEDHLKNKDRLEIEWESLEAYQPELEEDAAAMLQSNNAKNRFQDIIPCKLFKFYLKRITKLTFYFRCLMNNF